MLVGGSRGGLREGEKAETRAWTGERRGGGKDFSVRQYDYVAQITKLSAWGFHWQSIQAFEPRPPIWLRAGSIESPSVPLKVFLSDVPSAPSRTPAPERRRGVSCRPRRRRH